MKEELNTKNDLQVNILNNSPNLEYLNESINLDNPKSLKEIWQIEIPAINLIADISEGTTKETMDKYVGHFTDTNIFNGNVGLAAHNRGYPVNYFAKIKDLQKGDKIIYKTKDGIKTYLVDVITIIEDDDWSYLENTKDNRITLITCVENEPKYRRCIQGIEEEIL